MLRSGNLDQRQLQRRNHSRAPGCRVVFGPEAKGAPVTPVPGEYEFDVAVSFAGEDRELVQQVVGRLKAAGINVFYDNDHQADIWGEDLTEYLDQVYRVRARYVMMFISRFYADKMWTTHERRSALARAVEQIGAYVLPVRLDGTPIDGLRPTVGYLDARQTGLDAIVSMALAKLKGAGPAPGVPASRALGTGPTAAEGMPGRAPAPAPRTRTGRYDIPPSQSRGPLRNLFRRCITPRTAWGAAVITALGALLAWVLVPSGQGANLARPGAITSERGPVIYTSTVYAGGSDKFGDPQAITSARTHIWVANQDGDSVTELNASDGTLAGIISGTRYKFNGPSAITSEGTHVWVADRRGDSVTELNASNGTLERTISVGSYTTQTPGAIASDGRHIWVANYGADSVTELNASDGTLAGIISGTRYKFNGPSAIASDGTHVWVASYGADSVTELNASDGTLVRTISGTRYKFNGPVAITSDGTHVWVTNWDGDSVTELNASNGTLARTISASSYKFSHPGAITSDGTHVWVTNWNGDSVTELNASDGTLAGIISGTRYKFNGPSAITSEGMHVWVTNSGGNSVTEISARD